MEISERTELEIDSEFWTETNVQFRFLQPSPFALASLPVIAKFKSRTACSYGHFQDTLQEHSQLP